jgi:hypothetical protein
MPKRFTDTAIWNKEWFMELSPKLKCLIRYLFDNCDPSGTWTPNWKLASVHIGEEVNFSDLMKFPKEQFEILDNGKIFIPDFINFQYGNLSENSPAHKPIFAAIKKNSLSDRVFNRLSNRVSNTLQEKEKEKEEEKETEKDFGKSENLLETELSVFTLEAAERNQFTHTGNRNTEFIKQQWEIFTLERKSDSPHKKRENKNRLGEYFLNWVRTKFPKQINGKKVDTKKIKEDIEKFGDKKISEL